MKETFEKVDRYFYRRQYRTSGDDWRTHYYAVFTDWKRKRRRFPLGENIGRARNKLGEILKKNDAEFDFDKAEAERAAKGMTFRKWAAAGQASALHLRHLNAFFGDMPLSQISDDQIARYREKRAGETLIRHGKPSKVLVSQATINKEISSLRKLLKLARRKGFTDQVSEFKMEKETSRKRILSDEEQSTLLEHCPEWLRRVCVMANETALSRGDLFALTWAEIDLKHEIIELDRKKTGAQQAIPIVSATLKAIIAELQAERRRLPNVDGLVFTIDGKAISKNFFDYWFRKARKEAGIRNFRFHDLRHCAITTWAAAGIPTAAAMLAAGHTSVQSQRSIRTFKKTSSRTHSRNC